MKKRVGIGLILMVMLLGGCRQKEAVVYDLSPELEATSVDQGQDTEETSEEMPEETSVVVVYVCGAVQAPGVYELPEGSRVYEAVAAAGGMTAEADERMLNQAQLLQDGQQIVVYTEEETASGIVSGFGGDGTAVQDSGTAAGGRVNLNTAGRELLMTLPGIGETRADAILKYREEQGGFSSIEEIKNIEGIKEKVFEKLQDLIEV